MGAAINAAEIGVTVKDGVVTLTGSVDSYSKKSEADTAAKNVAGVRPLSKNLKLRMEREEKLPMAKLQRRS